MSDSDGVRYVSERMNNDINLNYPEEDIMAQVGNFSRHLESDGGTPLPRFGADSYSQWGGPQFPSTQPSQSVPNNTQAPKKKGRKSASTSTAPTRVKWAPGEEINLAKSWLNNSVDSIVGQGQRNENYWGKVQVEFMASRAVGDPPREVRACKDHWFQMGKKVTKFNDKYVIAGRNIGSGGNEVDVLAKARELYKQEEGMEFPLEHVWKVIKDQPKWKPQDIPQIDVDQMEDLDAESAASKRTRLDESSNYTSDASERDQHDHELNDLGWEERPIGQKRAKAKARGKAKAGDPPTEKPLIPPQELEYLNKRNRVDQERNQVDQERNRVDLLRNQVDEGKNVARKEIMVMLNDLLKKDTSNMTDVEKGFHMCLIDSLGKSLSTSF